jgi:hypothetical protein
VHNKPAFDNRLRSKFDIRARPFGAEDAEICVGPDGGAISIAKIY